MDLPTTLTRNDAQRFLMRAGFASGTLPYPQLRQALAIIVEHCDYQIFGVCAGDAETAIRALHNYTDRLPLVDRKKPDHDIGRSTEGSILNRLYSRSKSPQGLLCQGSTKLRYFF